MITSNIDNEHYITEIVFYENGKVYKQPSSSELAANYVKDPYASNIFPFSKKDGKKYKWSQEMLEYFDSKYKATEEYIMKIPSVPISPSIDFIVAIGEYSDPTKPIDLFFNVSSMKQLRLVCEYYALPFPLNTEQEKFLDNNLSIFAFKQNSAKTVVPAGIKFENGIPILIKLYLYPKYYKHWKLWMTGTSFFNEGTVKELGCILRSSKEVNSEFCTVKNMHIPEMRQTEVVYSETGSEVGVYTVCPSKHSDPLVFWEKLVIDSTGTVINKKIFKSTSYGASIVGLTNFLDYDVLPPPFPVKGANWVATSWYDHSINDIEWFFPVVDMGILDTVAKAYNLPHPLPKDTDLTVLGSRASHYPLGGSFLIPVSIGSVVFKEGSPTQLLFYDFSRQWESDKTLKSPSTIKTFLDMIQ